MSTSFSISVMTMTSLVFMMIVAVCAISLQTLTCSVPILSTQKTGIVPLVMVAIAFLGTTRCRLVKLLDQVIDLGLCIESTRWFLGVFAIGCWWPTVISHGLTILFFSQCTQVGVGEYTIMQVQIFISEIIDVPNPLECIFQKLLLLHQCEVVLTISICLQAVGEDCCIELEIIDPCSKQCVSLLLDLQCQGSDVFTQKVLQDKLVNLFGFLGNFPHGITLDLLNEHHPEDQEGRLLQNVHFNLESQNRILAVEHCRSCSTVIGLPSY